MDARLAPIAAAYRRRRSGDAPAQLEALSRSYQQRREHALLDTISAAGAAYGLFMADRITYSTIDGQMREAFELANPSRSLEWVSELVPASREAVLRSWKGKYFEVLVRDKLNDGEAVGDLYLLEGQRASLAANLNQPGWDLEIVADGSAGAIDLFQLKATESLRYVRRALERYPDIKVIATDEVGGLMGGVASSGISDLALENTLLEPWKPLVDSPLVDLGEELLPFLPFVIIVIGEGRHVIAGRHAFAEALRATGWRSAKSSAAIGVGGIVAFLDGGLLSLPATALTRLSFDRYQHLGRAAATLEILHRQAASLLPAYDRM